MGKIIGVKISCNIASWKEGIWCTIMSHRTIFQLDFTSYPTKGKGEKLLFKILTNYKIILRYISNSKNALAIYILLNQ